jgi:serine/threonine protein phosphatase PrpC/CRP-like cAMP-binding protein
MSLADQITFFAATDTGRKRKHNEDNFLVDHELGLYIVADGMGGHAAGEVASAIAVRTVHEVLNGEREMLTARAEQGPQSEVSSKQLLSLLDYAIQTASQRIHAEARDDPRKRGMGTTISLLLIIDRYGYVAHVGDSRIYLMRDNAINQVTEDHTVANELIRLGMVTPDQLDKVPRKNAITRAVGVYAHAEVDTLTLEILPNDQFLLASDGLCGYFDDKPEEDLRSYLDDEDGDSAVKSLIEFANTMGGKDNITAVLVRAGGGDTSDSVRARRLQLKREMLASMPLFSRLNERELLRVMQIADVYEYERGEAIVNEGEQGERMFVTLQGKLEVITNNQKVAEYGPGEHFGEMALIRSRPRSATIRAVERSEVISLKREDFFELIRVDPHIAVKLLWQFLGVIANRLEVTSRDLSKALGEGKPPPKPWVDDEPSLDPFTTTSGVNRLSFHPEVGAPHPFNAAVADAGGEESIAQRTDGPSFDEAPALAARVPSPGPKTEEFDARSTMPRQTEPAPDEGKEDEGFDKRKTLPGRRRRRRDEGRNRQETLKSAASVGGFGDAARDGRASSPATQTSAPSDPHVVAPVSSSRDASTKPDGKLREAREHALQEEAISIDDDASMDDDADMPLDKKKTMAMPRKEKDSFRPTKRTIPLEPTDSLRSELDALRKEFKERLKKSRRARKQKDSD